jgi:osmotically-inducible protein OsmY
VVTLFGTAPTAGDREQAARVAASVDGVRSVLNNLVVVAGS